jgi:hypothetical protein
MRDSAVDAGANVDVGAGVDANDGATDGAKDGDGDAADGITSIAREPRDAGRATALVPIAYISGGAIDQAPLT